MNPNLNKVMIIGTGKWGARVAGILSSDNRFSVKTLPARKFLEQQLDIDLQDIDIIWICTTLETQLKVVRFLALMSFMRVVVIEKPFYQNSEDFEEILKAKIKNPQLRISNPWTFGKLWVSARSILLQNFQEGEACVVRGGPETRNYLSPPKDWLFHDLILIDDLAKSLKSEVHFVEQYSTKDENVAKVQLNLGKLHFNLLGGYFKDRRAFWNATNKGHVINIDFSTMTLMSGESSLKNSRKLEFPDDHPIISMLNSFGQNSQTFEHFKEQVILIKNI